MSASVDEFTAFSATERQQLLQAAIDWRFDQQSNIEFTAASSFYQVRLDGASFTRTMQLEPLGLVTVSHVRQKRIARSYLSEQFVPLEDGQTGLGDLYCRNSYDADAATNKGFVNNFGPYAGSGRISNRQDRAEHMNRVNYLFEGEHTSYGRCLYKELKEMIRDPAAAITIDGEVVRLVVDRALSQSPQVVRRRIAEFDPVKQFLPVLFVSKRVGEDGETTMFDAVDVLADTKVDGFVFPTRVRMIRSPKPVVDARPAAVRDFTFTDVKRGHLRAQDLKFEFPENTLVVDAISKSAYIDLGAGKRRDLETPLAFNPDRTEGEAPSGLHKGWLTTILMIFNLSAVATVAAYFLWRKNLRPAQ